MIWLDNWNLNILQVEIANLNLNLASVQLKLLLLVGWFGIWMIVKPVRLQLRCSVSKKRIRIDKILCKNWRILEKICSIFKLVYRSAIHSWFQIRRLQSCKLLFSCQLIKTLFAISSLTVISLLDLQIFLLASSSTIKNLVSVFVELNLIVIFQLNSNACFAISFIIFCFILKPFSITFLKVDARNKIFFISLLKVFLIIHEEWWVSEFF